MGEEHVLDKARAGLGFRFHWHRDNEVEGSEDVERTIVILLSDTQSSMQVKGFKEYAFDGQGSAVMFDSNAVHRSGHAAAGTVKLAIFLRPRCPRLSASWRRPPGRRRPCPSARARGL